MVRASQTKGKITSKIKPVRIVFNPNGKLVVEHVGKRVITRTGKYAHFCYEWDEMLIDETDPEFASCLCGMPNLKT